MSIQHIVISVPCGSQTHGISVASRNVLAYANGTDILCGHAGEVFLFDFGGAVGHGVDAGKGVVDDHEGTCNVKWNAYVN